MRAEPTWRTTDAGTASTPLRAPAALQLAGSVVPGDAGPVVVAELARRWDELVPADVADRDLVEAVAGWEHVIGAAVARQALALRELAARLEVSQTRTRYLPDELACALATTRRAAEVLLSRAEGLGECPQLEDALLSGAVDVRKADVVLDEVGPLGPGARDVVVADAIARAETCTAPQLRRHVRRAVLAAVPTETAARAERARADRRVTLDWCSDSMAYVSAYLPAPDAVAVFTAVDALAGAHAEDGDERTVDQRRADAFTAVFTRMLDTQEVPGVGPLPRRHGRRTALQVTVAASTLLGLDDQPAELGSYGPIPASLARELARDATWRRILTDPVSGAAVDVGAVTYRPGADLTRRVVARDVTCTFFGCRQPAWRGDLDHVVPFDPDRPAHLQTTADNLHALCRRHHQAKTHGGWSVGRDRRTGATWWTSPLGLTSIRHPVLILATPTALHHGPPDDRLEGPNDRGVALASMANGPPPTMSRSGSRPDDPPPF